MARGIGENPSRSPAWHLQQLDYPTTREEIVQTAGENEAPAEVINFLKALPKERYQSIEEALRDFAEAERVVLTGRRDGASLDDLGRNAFEKSHRHP